MSEAEREVQMEQSSQAGSVVDPMDLEPVDEGAETLVDADMEVHDLEAEGHTKDLQESIAQDEDMAAEMAEQEEAQLEREWRDPAVDPVTIDLTEESSVPADAPVPEGQPAVGSERDPHTEQKAVEDGQTTLPASLEARAAESDAYQSGQPDATKGTGTETDGPSTADGPSESTTTESINGHVAGVSEPKSSREDSGDVDQSIDTVLPGESEEFPNTDGDVADATTEYEQADETFDVEAYITGFEHEEHRPLLQKDYLNHVETSQDELGNSHAAPHVSLTYDNQEYSLFRPSSSPSGDSEKVLFAVHDESGDQGHNSELYFASLASLMRKLHEAFPQLRGDGDNELIFDFGILDMQISEDNVYADSVSLYDIDRIRIGMCQPELDRLHISVVVGKRFVYKFNELAEHVYRMYAGSEDDDSGTIYEETIVPDQAEDDAKHANVDGPGENDAGLTDYTTGENVENLENRDHQLNELEDAKNEAEASDPPNAAADDTGTSHDEATLDVDEGATIDSHAEGKTEGAEVHLNEVPEYEEAVGADQGADNAAEYGEETENLPEYEEYEDNNEDTGQYEDAEQDGSVFAEEETVEASIPADAPLEDAAEQAEVYEEGVLEAEETAVHEGEAHGHLNGTTSASEGMDAVSRSTNANSDEQEAEYYHNLTSPTNEEVVIVESIKPGDTDTEIQPGDSRDVQSAKASVVDAQGYIEEETDNNPSQILPGKRNREDQGTLDDAAGDGQNMDGELDAKRARVSV